MSYRVIVNEAIVERIHAVLDDAPEPRRNAGPALVGSIVERLAVSPNGTGLFLTHLPDRRAVHAVCERPLVLHYVIDDFAKTVVVVRADRLS